MSRFTLSHWGVYEVTRDATGAPTLSSWRADPNPSPIGLSALDATRSRSRIAAPAVRRSWLEAGPGARPDLRGREPFIEVDWDVATTLVADEIARVRRLHGNEAIFGGSYGWSSAGRFHHAQSQVHRFLNAAGGYTRHLDTYSLGAARALMSKLVAPMEDLMANHTSWDVLAEHTTLFVTLGGAPEKNAQITAGGVGRHALKGALARMRERGVEFVNISPVRDDISPGGSYEWLPIRPNTDTALLLALAHTLLTERLHTPEFIERCTAGFDTYARYLMGAIDGREKTADWASGITGIDAGEIRALARRMAANRTMINSAWSVQRAQHGEQPYWALINLAAMLGQIGTPGGGFGLGYGAVNAIGSRLTKFSGPTLSQGRNPVATFIPVARIADMLMHPGDRFTYDGKSYEYPWIKLIYWAGGNPFHHHQDLNRLMLAWRRPETIIVHEQMWNAHAKMADIVLPATTTLERDDIGYATREGVMVAMRRVVEPFGRARDDYAIFSDIAARLGVGAAFTEGRSTQDWLRALYDEALPRAAGVGVALPDFDTFWDAGLLDVRGPAEPVVMLEAFVSDPKANPLSTESGKLQMSSPLIASYGHADCPGHPAWLAPDEWFGGALASQFPLHLISDQPSTKLHSQLDNSALSRGQKRNAREAVWMHPDDAARRGIAEDDIVRVFNGRGACVATARVSDGIASGVVKMSTGSWFDPGDMIPGALERHGNPNVLTADVPSSQLTQACAAQSCLVQIEKFEGVPPPVTAFAPPVVLTALD